MFLKAVVTQAHPAPGEKGLLSSPLLEPSKQSANKPRVHPFPPGRVLHQLPTSLTAEVCDTTGTREHFLREGIGHQDSELERGGWARRKKASVRAKKQR